MDLTQLDAMHPAMALTLACCRFPSDVAAGDAIRSATMRITDWDEFERTVAGHRVSGLVAHALSKAPDGVPTDVLDRIASVARRATLLELGRIAELRRLQADFDAAAVPLLFVKGATLGMLAYRRLGLKQSWDIDLLTTPDRLLDAKQLLEAAGYRMTHPADLNGAKLVRYARFAHEAQFVGPSGTIVELHWRLFVRPHLLPGVGADSPSQLVAVGGAQFRTLRDDLLIPYLIAHGQGHGWSRIKWLADLNALLAQRSADDLDVILCDCQQLGVGDACLAALVMCHRWMGLALPPSLAQRANARGIADLIRVNAQCIAHRTGGRWLPMLSRANLRLTASRFGGARGWRLWPTEVAMLWTQPAIRARFPARADGLYHLVRIPLFFAGLPGKVVQRARSKA